MKKLILLSALAASISIAKADNFSDIFKLTYNGEALENGQTITVKEYHDPNHEMADLIPGYVPMDYEAAAKIIANNISEEPWMLDFTLSRTAPSIDEYPVFGSEIGSYQLCYSYNENEPGQCLSPINGNEIVPGNDYKEVDSEGMVIMDIHQAAFTDLNVPVTLKLDLRITEGGETIEGGTATIYLTFTHEIDTDAAVGAIEADHSLEYFNLQGLRVAQPQKGNVYIVRSGSTVTKMIF